MRYIGNKENIVEKIDSLLQNNGVCGERFFDFFSGTTSVAKYYKQKGYEVSSADQMYMSFCLQKAYIENNEIPLFSTLLANIGCGSSNLLFTTPIDIVLDYLNNLPPVEGFIFQNYTPGGTSHLEQPRMYFTSENGRIVDAIRTQIEIWKNNELISEYEYYILITCLLETISFYSNVAGVYAAFYKKWDPRAIKKLTLRPLKFYNNNRVNKVYNCDSMELLDVIDTDILYLDPPYNQRQYFPNYHLLETIAKYDSPEIKGVTGMRVTGAMKSRFCNSKTALQDLDQIASTTKFKHLVLSYNSEGIMPQDDIISVLSKYGKVVLKQFDNARFKSNNNGLAKTKRVIDEQIYILSK